MIDDATFRSVWTTVVEAMPDALLWHGTLLGCWRDGRLIPWDQDIDIIVPHDRFVPVDGENGRSAWAPWMDAYGGPRAHGNVHLAIGGVKVGLHLTGPGPEWGYYTREPWGLMKHPWPWPSAPARLAGVDVAIPGNTAECVEWLYGPNWQTPDPGYLAGPDHRRSRDRWIVWAPR